MNIRDLLQNVIDNQGSDLHLTVGAPPVVRIDGKLKPIGEQDPLTPTDVENLVFSILSAEQKEMLMMNKELDFSFAYGDVARFRVNAFHQRGISPPL